MHPADDPTAHHVSPRRAFWVATVLFGLIGTLWSLAAPLMSAPDEAAHAIKAAAVVRGEFLGDEDGMVLGRGVVTVPALFSRAAGMDGCYAGDPQVPATCERPLTGDLAVPQQAVTSAVRYNPLYYALAGLPSLVSSSAGTLYAMRIAGALAAAVLLGLTVRTLAETRRPAWPLVGFAAATVPMLFYLAGSINPQSVEIPAALLAWSALSALLTAPDPRVEQRRLVRLTIGVAVLANVRGLGPQLTLLLVAAVVLTARRGVLPRLLRRRTTWPHLAAMTVAVGIAVLWNRLAGTVTTTDVVRYPQYSGAAILDITVGKTDDYLRQSLGVFGRLNTVLPMWTYLGLGALILLVVLLGVAAGTARERLAMVGVAAVVLVLPSYAEFSQARFIGTFWQGRYALPLAVGVPVLAGFALRRHAPRLISDELGRRVLGIVGTAAALLQTAALVVLLRRHVTGIGPDNPWFDAPAGSWLPPVSPYLLTAVHLAAWATVAVLLVWASRPRPAGTPARSEQRRGQLRSEEHHHGLREPGAHVVVVEVDDEPADDRMAGLRVTEGVGEVDDGHPVVGRGRPQ